MSDYLDAEARNLRRQLADTERRAAYAKGAPTVQEGRELRDVQARADSIFVALGHIGSPPPMNGELPSAYRSRLAENLQKYAYSPDLRQIEIRELGLNPKASRVFANFEQQIYADAQRRADDMTWSPVPGQLREITSRRRAAGGSRNLPVRAR